MKTICALTLAVAGLMISVARADSPKSYSLTLGDVKLGQTAVDAGDYKLLVHRDVPQVQLMDKSGNVIDVAATLQNGEEKFSQTEIHSRTVDGKKEIFEIRLGGTKTTVEFRKPS